MLSRIHNLLEFCYGNIPVDKLPTIKQQLFLITVKSLIPYEDNIGCLLDEIRYEKEIELFEYYKNGLDDNLEYYYKNKEPSEKEDDFLEFKLLPIIIANPQWDNLIIETLKISRFYSLNKNAILNTIILSSTINEYLNNGIVNIENINEITKERLINFSLKDLLNSYNLKVNKKSLIEFEQERIKLLSKNEIISDEFLKKFLSLDYIFNLNSNMDSDIDKSVLSSFSLYLFKLRKGIINPEKLKVQLNNMQNIKEYIKYSTFNHPLLGNCKVLRRGEKEVILRNKSGLIKVNI